MNHPSHAAPHMYLHAKFGRRSNRVHISIDLSKIQSTNASDYYAALLSRRGAHIASHSVRPSVSPSVPLSLPSVTSFRQPLASRMYFSARTKGRMSYGHLGRTNSCYYIIIILSFTFADWHFYFLMVNSGLSVFIKELLLLLLLDWEFEFYEY